MDRKQTWWNPQREDPVKQAIRIMRENEPPEGYELAFSGGKDSVVLYALAEEAGVKFDPVYNATGIDPPELTRFIREHYPQVRWRKPEKPYFQLIMKKGLATRVRRWCCEYLKEQKADKAYRLLGVRRDESTTRKGYADTAEGKYGGWVIRPMLDWSIDEVWWYIKQHNLSYCDLYDKGFDRLGCVLCPFLTAIQLKRSEERWPKYWMAFRSVLARWYEKKKDLMEGRYGFTCFEEFYWNWHGRRGPWPWKDKQRKLNL
jgi:phosphoadenosine phosphosulfate reductase